MTDQLTALRELREKMAEMNEIPIIDLRRFLSYDPATGDLRWRERMSQNVFAGSEAMTARKGSGHRHGFVRGVPLQAHRVAWALHYGEWPQGMIDHINGIPTDNRIINLRVVSARDNPKNRRPNSDKPSALPHGVSRKKNGRYFAQIQEGKKNRHLGYFATPEEAEAAYKAAATKLGFHPNHGLPALIAKETDDADQ